MNNIQLDIVRYVYVPAQTAHTTAHWHYVEE